MSDSTKYTTLHPTHPQGQSARPKWQTALFLIGGVIALSWVYTTLVPGSTPEPQFLAKKAVAVLSGDSSVAGTVTFTQSSALGPVTVSAKIKGLDKDAKRGFHIHQLGDLSGGCVSASSHFNPFGKTHGSPTDSERHVGDLGNIQSNSTGYAVFSFEDKLLSLNGPLSIIGRSVVVHAGTDDLGKGGDDESLKTGNAGGRAACGVIGLSELA